MPTLKNKTEDALCLLGDNPREASATRGLLSLESMFR